MKGSCGYTPVQLYMFTASGLSIPRTLRLAMEFKEASRCSGRKNCPFLTCGGSSLRKQWKYIVERNNLIYRQVNEICTHRLLLLGLLLLRVVPCKSHCKLSVDLSYLSSQLHQNSNSFTAYEIRTRRESFLKKIRRTSLWFEKLHTPPRECG